MRYSLLLLLTSFIVSSTIAQSNQSYNKALADSLGADEYGMKSYVLVILKTGKKEITEKSIRDSIFAGHMANITRLVEEGKMIVAGPLGKNDQQYRGIFIFDVKTIEEARKLASTDPVIISGLMDAEYFSWYGSAALPLYLKEHDKVQKTSF